MAAILAAADREEKCALLLAHPVLGGAAARSGQLTRESTAEQAGQGLDRMAAEEERRFAELNAAYVARFGFPFIIAVRGQKNRAAILAALEVRLESTAEAEFETALAEVVRIAGFRLEALVEEGAPALPLTLSLHVLDTARGGPGAGLAFALSRIAGEARVPLAEGETDAAGRWALDRSTALCPGIHEIIFEAGAYQARFGAEGFYDRIPIRFRLAADGGHYHLPLILSPFGYSTYRGG
jgi:2-oxo-4-hydroxy-4-carboxy-5-ureidoimidazoline decarboxylase